MKYCWFLLLAALATPASTEELSFEKQTALIQGISDVISAVCPNANNEIQISACVNKKSDATFIFVACGNSFVSKEDKLACYEATRERWIKDNM